MGGPIRRTGCRSVCGLSLLQTLLYFYKNKKYIIEFGRVPPLRQSAEVAYFSKKLSKYSKHEKQSFSVGSRLTTSVSQDNLCGYQRRLTLTLDPMTPSDSIMHAYVFHTYAHRCTQVGFVPSLIGVPQNGASAAEAYYVRVELPTRHISAMAKTHYVTEGELSPIVSFRQESGKTYYLPKDELEQIAAEHHDDDLFAMVSTLFRNRRF